MEKRDLAAGLFAGVRKFVLLMTVILAPATLLYVKARSEHGRRLFTPAEIALLALILVGAVVGAVGLSTGRIAL
jgi:arginine:ornithine antiporter/lysine permease